VRISANALPFAKIFLGVNHWPTIQLGVAKEFEEKNVNCQHKSLLDRLVAFTYFSLKH
jgi:hypothetical protein